MVRHRRSMRPRESAAHGCLCSPWMQHLCSLQTIVLSAALLVARKFVLPVVDLKKARCRTALLIGSVIEWREPILHPAQRNRHQGQPQKFREPVSISLTVRLRRWRPLLLVLIYCAGLWYPTPSLRGRGVLGRAPFLLGKQIWRGFHPVSSQGCSPSRSEPTDKPAAFVL